MAIREGVHDIPRAQYHADPCVEPSLSSSIGKILLDRSPAHAWVAHPGLNPKHVAEEADRFDLGTAAHSLILQGLGDFAIIDAPDWRTKAAKDARDDARLAGKTPLLAHRLPMVWAMQTALQRQIQPYPFEDGKPEQALVWKEGPIWCRALLDWLPDSGNVYVDYKTTEASAHPGAWSRILFATGGDFQAAFYRRGIRAVLGVESPVFRYIVQESSPPFAASIVELSPGAIDMGDRMVQAAIDLWTRCMETKRWPGYSSKPVTVDPPTWHEARWLEREAFEDMAKDQGIDTFAVSMELGRPL